MKSSIVAVAALVALVSAQFPGIPDCATPCLITAISSVGCALTDVGCQCSSTAQIQGGAAGCILAGCTKSGELQQAITQGGALCSSYLAAVSASTTSGSAVTTTTTSASKPPSSVPVQTTSIPSPSKGGFNTTSMITGTGTGAITTTRGGASTTASPASSQVPVGAGMNVAAGLGGVMAVFAAFFAL